MSESLVGCRKFVRSVNQIDKTTNEFIKKWSSISEAALFFNTSVTSIYYCCKGVNPTAKGFKWEYDDKKVIKK